MTYLWNSKMALSYLLLACYETRIVRFAYVITRYLSCVGRMETPWPGKIDAAVARTFSRE